MFSRAATDFGPSTNLHVNNLASDIKANPRDLYGTLIFKRKTAKNPNSKEEQRLGRVRVRKGK